MLNDDWTAAACASIDSLETNLDRKHIHVMHSCCVPTATGSGRTASVHEIEDALTTCMDRAGFADWEYGVLVLCLPWSASQICDVRREKIVDPQDMVTRVNDPAVELV